MTTPKNSSSTETDDQLGGYLLAGLVLAIVLWLVPTFAGLIAARSLPDMSVVEQTFGTAQIVTGGHFEDPRAAYPARARDGLPAGLWFYPAAGVPFALVVLAVALQWRRIDHIRSSARADRHPLDLRGSKPTTWARPRHLSADLVGKARDGQRFSLGRLRGKAISSDPESQIIVVAPPGAGKTTRLVIPWLLEHDGPAIVTTTKNDVAPICSRWRRQLGDVYLWDPFNPRASACWTPLDGCEDWGYALEQAYWLAQAGSLGPGEGSAAHFWNEEATTLLAPLLHAAALSGAGMDTVLRWLNQKDDDAPLDVLRSDGADAASDELAGVGDLDPRNRSTYYMSCKHLLKAYKHPAVLATTKSGLTPADFFDGGAHTLMITAGKRRQKMLAPLIAAMLSSLLHQQKENVRARGLDGPIVRILLDECAQIARLDNLEGEVAEARGQNIRFALVYQTESQIYERHGAAGAQAMLGASSTRIYLGSTTDKQTHQDLIGLLGDREDPRHPGGHRPLVSAQELGQLDEGRAILLAGSNPPAIVTLDPYWKLKHLDDRAEHRPL
jgi:type IV secretion system protein VirD4